MCTAVSNIKQDFSIGKFLNQSIAMKVRDDLSFGLFFSECTEVYKYHRVITFIFPFIKMRSNIYIYLADGNQNSFDGDVLNSRYGYITYKSKALLIGLIFTS